MPYLFTTLATLHEHNPAQNSSLEAERTREEKD